LVFIALTITTFGQGDKQVKLQWKVATDERLSYMTVMKDLDTPSVEINSGDFFNFLGDSSKKVMSEMKNFFKELNRSVTGFDYVTVLTNKGNDVIDVEMISKSNDNDSVETKNSIMKLLQNLNNGIVLRGSVYATGGIHSFWIKTSQKNLISTLFELPAKPVKVGDCWPLAVNFIENEQNFKCDSSYKLNKVTLVDIKKVNNENIAVLKYDIVEYVKGIFNSPFGSAKSKLNELMIRFEHQALAEFSIDKGKWMSYDGIMSVTSTGMMKGNKKTKLSLIEVK
jgi:hypothetical protein